MVHTGAWWPGEKVLISPLSIKRIGWARSILNLDATKQKIKASPACHAGSIVDGAYDESFMTYYGTRWISKNWRRPFPSRAIPV